MVFNTTEMAMVMVIIGFFSLIVVVVFGFVGFAFRIRRFCFSHSSVWRAKKERRKEKTNRTRVAGHGYIQRFLYNVQKFSRDAIMFGSQPTASFPQGPNRIHRLFDLSSAHESLPLLTSKSPTRLLVAIYPVCLMSVLVVLSQFARLWVFSIVVF